MKCFFKKMITFAPNPTPRTLKYVRGKVYATGGSMQVGIIYRKAFTRALFFNELKAQETFKNKIEELCNGRCSWVWHIHVSLSSVISMAVRFVRRVGL